MRNFLAFLILSVAFTSLPQSSWAGDLRISLILSDTTQPYQSFAQTLKSALPNSIQLSIQDVRGKPGAAPVDLVIAVGIKAAEGALSAPGTPLLVVMVPKGGYDSLVMGLQAPHEISAIYLDQPWGRQFDFLYALMPGLNRVGLVYSPETQSDAMSLQSIARSHGGKVSLQVVRSADGLFASLEKALTDSDVLLAIPDHRIFNASNIRNILLTSYRHKVPLIGFSQGYVNAGALAAIYTQPEQMARQAASQIIEYKNKKTLPAPRYPDEFTISVNLQVARSLGIFPPSEEVIRKRMSQTGEGGR